MDNQEMTEEEVGQRILTALKKVSPSLLFCEVTLNCKGDMVLITCVAFHWR